MWKYFKAGLLVLGAMVIISLALFGLSRLDFIQNLITGNERPGIQVQLEKQESQREWRQGLGLHGRRLEQINPGEQNKALPGNMERYNIGHFSRSSILLGVISKLLMLVGAVAIVIGLWKGGAWLLHKSMKHHKPTATPAEPVGSAMPETRVTQPSSPNEPENKDQTA